MQKRYIWSYAMTEFQTAKEAEMFLDYICGVEKRKKVVTTEDMMNYRLTHLRPHETIIVTPGSPNLRYKGVHRSTIQQDIFGMWFVDLPTHRSGRNAIAFFDFSLKRS